MSEEHELTKAVRCLELYIEGTRMKKPSQFSIQFLMSDLIQLLIRHEKGNLERVWATINTAEAMAETRAFGEVRS